MMEKKILLENVRNKVNILISKYEKEVDVRKTLEVEKEELIKLLAEKELLIEKLENKNKKLQLATAFKSTSVDAQEAKLKISKIVREIDKCVALLNK